MEEIGQRERALVAGAPVTLAACALALGAAACVVAWPFAIDDAFIGIRYARHLVAGDGYVWNVGGPSTDGVTPLPWAFLLAPVARAAPVVVLLRAKALGALVFSATAAVGASRWVARVRRCGRRFLRSYCSRWIFRSPRMR